MAGHKNIDPEVGKETQWKKGQSGNPKGRPSRLKRLGEMLGITFPKEADYDEIKEILGSMLFMNVIELQQLAKKKETPVMMVSIASSLVKSINKGDVDNLEKIISRIHGKPKQVNEHTGEGGGPIQITEVRQYDSDKEADGSD